MRFFGVSQRAAAALVPDPIHTMIVVMLLAARAACAEPVTTILNNGSAANRIDIVILGDGYTAQQLQLYADAVQTFVDGFFAQEPFKEYKRYFNVHRIDVVSNQSGADHPENDQFRDTALGANYNCSSIQRLLCVDNSAVTNIVNTSVAANARDITIVLVNDPEYGGSGGAIAVASSHASTLDVVLHEVGHSFALLADEYDTAPPTCNNTTEPSQPNVTRHTGRNSIKWNTGGGPPRGWIEATTSLPTTDSSAGVVGAFEGARYCASGLFRPTWNSKMRSLGRPFGQVNEEQIVKRIYNFVSPLESSTPAASSFPANHAAFVRFTANTLTPLTQALSVNWYIDGVPQGSGREFSLDSSNLSIGSHTVRVIVQDNTERVRNDPALLLRDTRAWTVEVADTDGDGIPDGIESAHGLDPLNPADAARDLDGDGFSNREEYEDGTDLANNQSNRVLGDEMCFPIKVVKDDVILMCL